MGGTGKAACGLPVVVLGMANLTRASFAWPVAPGKVKKVKKGWHPIKEDSQKWVARAKAAFGGLACGFFGMTVRSTGNLRFARGTP